MKAMMGSMLPSVAPWSAARGVDQGCAMIQHQGFCHLGMLWVSLIATTPVTLNLAPASKPMYT